MHNRGYVLRRDIGRFILKRVMRIDPPYFAAAGLTLLFWYLSAWLPGFRGQAPSVTAGQVLAHVGYLNELLGLPWLGPVFWSLAIEFQFYLLIALLFPVVTSNSATIRLVGLAGVWCAAMIGAPAAWVVPYLGMFGCGMVVFERHRGAIGRPVFTVMLIAMAAATWRTQGFANALVCVGTAVVILSGRGGSVIGSWLGAISYSLYLVHVPVGGRVVNAGVRAAAYGIPPIVTLVAALIASLGAAVAFYRLIERPAQDWAASLKYRGRIAAPCPAGASPGIALRAVEK